MVRRVLGRFGPPGNPKRIRYTNDALNHARMLFDLNDKHPGKIRKISQSYSYSRFNTHKSMRERWNREFDPAVLRVVPGLQLASMRS